MSIFAVDLGGSHVSCAIVKHRRILAERTFKTEAQSIHTTLIDVEAAFRECLSEAAVVAGAVSGVAIGYPGIVAGATNEILSTLDKYPDVTGEHLAGWARNNLGLPLRLENDARLALLGEFWAGAGEGASDIVMITLGTGIGGAAMIDGRLLRSRAGHAGSLGGHLPVRMNGRLCACGAIGCAEAEASTSTLPILCREWPAFAASSLAGEAHLNFETLFRAVDRGDRIADQILAYCIQVWSVLTVGLIHAYGPELVLFGGGVMHRGDTILSPIQSYVEKHMWRTTRGLPRIASAKLGSRAALIGAACLFEEERAFA